MVELWNHIFALILKMAVSVFAVLLFPTEKKEAIVIVN